MLDPQTRKLKRISLRTKDAGAAQAMALALARTASGAPAPKKGISTSPTLSVASERFLAERGGKSVESTRARLNWWVKTLEDPLIDRIPSSAIRRHLNEMVKTTSNATANRYLAAIRAVLRAACYEWDILKDVPRIKQFREGPGRDRWLNADEIDRLVKHAGSLRPIVVFALAVGHRWSALTGLTWDRVLLDRRFCYLDRSTSKNNQQVGIPLNDAAMEVLVQLQAERKPGARYVFGNGETRMPPLSKKVWAKVVTAAELPGVTFHVLRHTWASHHAMNGTPPEVLMKLGGWQSRVMVDRYAHLSQIHVAEHANNAAMH